MEESKMWAFVAGNTDIIPRFPNELICFELADEFPLMFEAWIAEHLEKFKGVNNEPERNEKTI